MFKAFLLKLSIDIMENSVSKKTTLGSLIALVKIPAIILLTSPYTAFGVQSPFTISKPTSSSTYDKFEISQNWPVACQRNSFTQDFLYALAVRETGSWKTPYNTSNGQGAYGKYQFTNILLRALGYQRQGRWTGKNGVYTTAEFLSNKNNVQEIAIREAFLLNWNSIENKLRQRGRSLKDYLGRTIEDATITSSGILAAAHVTGDVTVVNLLLTGQASSDSNGTTNLCYLKEFAGYRLPRL
jgi:hypothetical protein